MNNNVFNLQYFDNNISEMERVLDNELKSLVYTKVLDLNVEYAHSKEPVKSHFISWSWISFTAIVVISLVLNTSHTRQVPSLDIIHIRSSTSNPLQQCWTPRGYTP